MHSASISCGRRALLEKGQRRAPLFRGVVVISPRDSGTQAYPSLCGLGFWQLLWGCAALVTASVAGGGCSLLAACVRCAALLVAIVGCAALLTASVGCAAPLWAALLTASVGCAALLAAFGSNRCKVYRDFFTIVAERCRGHAFGSNRCKVYRGFFTIDASMGCAALLALALARRSLAGPSSPAQRRRG